jgi:hypothetical protein
VSNPTQPPTSVPQPEQRPEVESIHNVTVTLCVEGRKDDPAAAFRDANQMLASVARFI